MVLGLITNIEHAKSWKCGIYNGEVITKKTNFKYHGIDYISKYERRDKLLWFKSSQTVTGLLS